MNVGFVNGVSRMRKESVYIRENLHAVKLQNLLYAKVSRMMPVLGSTSTTAGLVPSRRGHAEECQLSFLPGGPENLKQRQ